MKSSIKKYLGEGMLIVFSVLFALFINKSFEDYKVRQTKAIAKESIIKELLANQSILAKWKTRHNAIKERISLMINGQGDSLKAELRKNNYLNLGVLTDDEALIDAILTNTAWESAKATGIITEFDFETIRQLTLVYDVQNIIMDKTVMGILDCLFEPQTNDLGNLDRTLVQLRLRFQELTGQEETMSALYHQTIQALKE